MRIPRSLIVLVLCCAMLVGSGGAAAAHEQSAAAFGTPVTAPPQGKYLFVEMWTNVNGTGNVPSYIVDFPSYSFNPTTGELQPAFGQSPQLPPLHPRAWGFTGSGYSRSGTAGSGYSNYLDVITTLPLRSGDFLLHAIDATGTLSATIDGKDVVLAAGQQWKKVFGEDVTSDGYNGHYDITSTVTNYGWLNRAQIEGPTQWIWLPNVRLPARAQP